MRLTRATKRVMNNDDGLIPMINIVFLLLVFFMVAGTVKPGEPLDIEPPESVQSGDQSAARVVHVAVDGSLAFDGRLISEAELGLAITTMIGESESSELDQRRLEPLSDDPASGLAIHADGQITFERLREVINLLGDAGVSDVELLTAFIPSVED